MDDLMSLSQDPNIYIPGTTTNGTVTATTRGPRGYDAYEVALQSGFVGTEEEWLATLTAVGEEQVKQLAIPRDGSLPPTADIPMDGHTVTGLKPPEDPTDAARKADVDEVALALVADIDGGTPTSSYDGPDIEGGTP